MKRWIWLEITPWAWRIWPLYDEEPETFPGEIIIRRISVGLFAVAWLRRK